MNFKGRNYILTGVVLVGLITLISVSYAQNGGTGNTGFQSVKIRKTQSLTSAWQKKIVINLIGMQNTDAINIRVAEENEINVKVVNTAEREVTVVEGTKILLPGNGAPISENALSVNTNEINFFRPQVVGKVLLDVELPQATEFDVNFNGEQVIKNTSLFSPISVKNGLVGTGDETTAKANARVMFPQLNNQNSDNDVLLAQNKYRVSFSKLQIMESNELQANSIKAFIEINEQGIVENVSVVEPLNSQEIKQNILLWKFVPYKKDGNAVKVSTVFTRN